MKIARDILIIGGGTIGCSIAYRLAREGLRVTVIERGRPGQEASRAAAGMLAPQSEAAHGVSGAFSDLCFASLDLYPEFVAELEEETGLKIGYQSLGSLFVATDFQEARTLAGLLERQQQRGRSAGEVTPGELRKLEPALATKIETSLFLPQEHHVDNRQLMEALISAASQRGVEFMTHTPVIGLAYEKNAVIGVRTPAGVIHAGVVINAAGSWSGLIDSGGRLNLPVRPIRGQMICLEVRPQPLHHLIHSTGCYLVPWPDGRILVGSTLENVGYNKQVTAEGIHQLLQAALKIVPSLASATIREVWAGLRPDTRDNRPILGKTRLKNLIVATGHFRNGILLTPITAKLISELVVKGEASISLAPFSPDRFE